VLALGKVEILDLFQRFIFTYSIWVCYLWIYSGDYGPYETFLVIVLDIKDTLFIFDELGCFKI